MFVRPSSSKEAAVLTAVLAVSTILTAPTGAQVVKPQPVTDSSAQASPLTPVPKAPVSDTSAQASPIPPERSGGRFIASHTNIAVALGEAIDSGKVKQGQNVKGRLTASVPVRGGAALPAGTPVVLTVIESVPAGRIMAQGEFSLQVVRVGQVAVYTNTLVFDGKPGHQDLPDSAPALGTDAGLPNGAPLTFQVQPPPVDADQLPQPANRGDSNTPGSVNGIASGSPPPPSAVKSTFDAASGSKPGSGNTPAQQQKSLSPGDTTTNQQTQQSGQTSVAPNQPQSPSQTSPNPGRPQ